MDSDFKDRFNYLTAFLAVIVGLAAFKDAADSNGLVFFGTHLSYLQLSLPLVGSMLLATYLGALTLIIRRWNFTLFPLAKYLETASYGIAAVGLLYPLLIPIALFLSLIATYVNAESFNRVLIGALLAQTAAFAYIATRYAFTKERDLTEEYLTRITEIERTIDTKSAQAKKTSSVVEMFEQYEYTLAKAKAYLRVRGYGTAGQNLGRLAQILNSKNAFNKEDMERARRVTNIRNLYAHAAKKPDDEEVARALTILEKLNTTLDDLLAGIAKAE